eukprot:7806419-Pyramimonas_sp.AAC.1
MRALSSKTTAGHNTGAGVAVFVRTGVGLRPPAAGAECLFPGRLQRVEVDLPGWPAITMFNLYLHPQ